MWLADAWLGFLAVTFQMLYAIQASSPAELLFFLCLQALIRKYMPVAVIIGVLVFVLWVRSYFYGRR